MTCVLPVEMISLLFILSLMLDFDEDLTLSMGTKIKLISFLILFIISNKKFRQVVS